MHRRCAASCGVCDTVALRDANSTAYDTHIKWYLDQLQYPPGGGVDTQSQGDVGADLEDDGDELLES